MPTRNVGLPRCEHVHVHVRVRVLILCNNKDVLKGKHVGAHGDDNCVNE